MDMKLKLQIVLAQEGKWVMASCPALGIGTQGKTKAEAKEMIADLVQEYLQDPDTVKPQSEKYPPFSMETFSWFN